MRVAHAELMHVVEGVADVIHARPTLPDALGHQARTPMQVELPDVRRVAGIGDEGERPDAPAPARADRDEARLVHAARHFPVP
jgi:hypothetical protein